MPVTLGLKVTRSFDKVLPDFTDLLRRSTASSYRLSRRSGSQAFRESQVRRTVVAPKPVQKTFLYVALKDIINLPDTDKPLLMQLKHPKMPVLSLATHYSQESMIELTDDTKPTFSIVIPQDDSEVLNYFSDSPLLVYLYEQEQELEDPEECEEPKKSYNPDPDPKVVAIGTIDIFQFFSLKRPLSSVTNFIYPNDLERFHANDTIQATWDIYGVMPLLKTISYLNVAFITLEAIYNVQHKNIKSNSQLKAKLYFQSTVKNKRGKFDRVEVGTFSGIHNELLSTQDNRQIWESLRNYISKDNLSLYTGVLTKMKNQFDHLLGTEGVEFNFDEIQTEEDSAFVCNGVHRFIMTETLCKMLEQAMAFGQQQLIIEITKSQYTKRVLYHGVIDLSVFLYPNVSTCRFAVKLTPSSSDESFSQITTFAIISICLLTPITEQPFDITQYNANYITREKLKMCKTVDPDSTLRTPAQICQNSYINFDRMVNRIIDYMIKNEIHSLDDDKDYFCCILKKLKSRLLQLICCDFNIRHPTKTNIEFNNLLTIVYRELEERINGTLQNYALIDLHNPAGGDDKLIYLMTLVKYAEESDNSHIAELIQAQIKEKFCDNPNLSFYSYIHQIERGNFEQAKINESQKTKDKLFIDEFFTNLVEIYIKYLEEMENEDTQSNAVETVLNALNDFVSQSPQESCGWVLLYCFYSRSHYAPGMTFARWQYESLEYTVQTTLPRIPLSLWNLYTHYEPDLDTRKARIFYSTLSLLSNLGLYQFAAIVFNEVSTEFSEITNSLISQTLSIFCDDQDLQMNPHATTRTTEHTAIKLHTNGNVSYAEGAIANAMAEYSKIINLKELRDFQYYQLGLIRLGYYKLSNHDFHGAIEIFDLCLLSEASLLANIGLAKAMYYMNELQNAEFYFSEATQYEVHIPDVWGYLALINLRKGNNFQALQSWKRAKLNPQDALSEEVLQELNKIDPESVCLYIDRPWIF